MAKEMTKLEEQTFSFLKAKEDDNIKDKLVKHVNDMYSSPGEKSVTTFEYAIKIMNQKIDSIFLQAKSKVVNTFKLRIRQTQEAYELPKYKTLVLALDMGLMLLEHLVKTNGESFDLGEHHNAKLATIEELIRISEIEGLIAMWEPIYNKKGGVGFTQWADETGQDVELVDKFLAEYSFHNPRMKTSKRDCDWLLNYLSSKPEMKASVTEIKKAAMAQCIIEDDKDWQRMQKNAERNEKVTKSYGEWQVSFFPLE